MKRTLLLIPILLSGLGIASPGYGEQNLPALHVGEAPTIDGLGHDAVWQNARVITTYDKSPNLPITIKAVYTDTELFLLISFPDPDESRTHKSWAWDKGREFYTVGNDREDIFTIKWNMEPQTVDLSIYADNPYQADIWYWKACRTDGEGYADDKSHSFSQKENRDAAEILSRTGKKMYLLRAGDQGTSAYAIDLRSDYEGEILPRYTTVQPTGSRADVRAKGYWKDGTWTIEFRRNLLTGNQDDVQFNTEGKYLFGVSRYEIADRQANQKLSDPLYGTGDVNENLWLEFKK